MSLSRTDLRDLLAMANVDVPEEQVRKWTPEQCAEAERWAALAFLHDKDKDVRLPPMPVWLYAFWVGAPAKLSNGKRIALSPHVELLMSIEGGDDERPVFICMVDRRNGMSIVASVTRATLSEIAERLCDVMEQTNAVVAGSHLS